MKQLLLALAMGPFLMMHVHANDAKEIKEDIQRHSAMAAAHESAAKCLEAGHKGHAICQKELQAACKGLAIGKACGMKHEH